LGIEGDKPAAVPEKVQGPSGRTEQIAALQEILRREAISAEEAADRFRGARLVHVVPKVRRNGLTT
jgi:hypothetical protein